MKKQLRKLFVSWCMLSLGVSLNAQPTAPSKQGELSTTQEKQSKDTSYELKHKKGRWFKKMNQPNVRYFSIKKTFDRHFGKHRWEESGTRELGESWIKTKLFYLDKKGRV